MSDNPAKFFDEILKLLATDYNRFFSFEEIQENLFPEDFPSDDGEGLVFEELILDNPNLSNIENALMFLNQQGLVGVNFETKQALINTAGFVKIKTQGFEEEIKEKDTNLKLQRWTWEVLPKAAIATASFAGLAFLLSLARFLFDIFC